MTHWFEDKLYLAAKKCTHNLNITRQKTTRSTQTSENYSQSVQLGKQGSKAESSSAGQLQINRVTQQ